MNKNPHDPKNKPNEIPPSPAPDDGPQLFALTCEAGGYKLSRRGFLGATAAVAAAATSGCGTTSLQSAVTASRRLKGNKLLVTDRNAKFLPIAHSASIYSVAFSPDGKRLASGSGDQTIKLWDVVSGELQRTLNGHKDPVASVAFSPDGQLLASGSWDKTIKLWAVVSGELQRTQTGHVSKVHSVAFSPDGKLLASG
ncbi:MAG TPA: twin-arginine translocation signal domain-containing protein, partial [Opitutaceae bacterium]|nr:twin-arginine translocation signal domain-containing protein [Opitutaceae bacterium]